MYTHRHILLVFIIVAIQIRYTYEKHETMRKQTEKRFLYDDHGLWIEVGWSIEDPFIP
jgi:hypothetical protein